MATLLEQIQKKVEDLGVGTIIPYSEDYSVEMSAKVKWLDPRHYKDIFKLDSLGIDKTIKSAVIEVKDGNCNLYYLLDSACFTIQFECVYENIYLLKELSIETIHYLRILCSKKNELDIYIDGIYKKIDIVFQDTYPSKMPTKERKEKVLEKYILSIPLLPIQDLDKEVVNFIDDELLSKPSEDPIYDSTNHPLSLPINLSNINCPYTKNPIEYWSTKVKTISGEFNVIYTSTFNIVVVICPILVSTRLVAEKSDDVILTKEVLVDISTDENLLEDEEISVDVLLG